MSMDTDIRPPTDRLSRILDEIEGKGDPASVSPPPAESAAVAQAPPASGASNFLGGLAVDPALLSSVLPALLSALPKHDGGGSAGVTDAAPAASKPAVPERAPRLDRHTALLCAVKPYLGERRQATAENVLRLCRIWDALNRAGISPSLLSGLLGGAGASPAEPPSDQETGG